MQKLPLRKAAKRVTELLLQDHGIKMTQVDAARWCTQVHFSETAKTKYHKNLGSRCYNVYDVRETIDLILASKSGKSLFALRLPHLWRLEGRGFSLSPPGKFDEYDELLPTGKIIKHRKCE